MDADLTIARLNAIIQRAEVMKSLILGHNFKEARNTFTGLEVRLEMLEDALTEPNSNETIFIDPMGVVLKETVVGELAIIEEDNTIELTEEVAVKHFDAVWMEVGVGKVYPTIAEVVDVVPMVEDLTRAPRAEDYIDSESKPFDRCHACDSRRIKYPGTLMAKLSVYFCRDCGYRHRTEEARTLARVDADLRDFFNQYGV